jgi:ADP-ribose pyrophosphatase
MKPAAPVTTYLTGAEAIVRPVPRILERRVEYSSPWLEVVAKEVELAPPRGRETFWAVRTHEYVAALAVTTGGQIPLVRQFRPAVEEELLELPSGSVEAGESPEEAMRRELLEETGCEAGELVPLGRLTTDSGRMETRQWAYFAPDVRRVREAPQGDEELELRFVEPEELRRLVADGELVQAIHLGIVGAAVVRGLL